MKKTSIALMLGLFAIGCGDAPKPKADAPVDPRKMMEQSMQSHGPGGPGGGHAATAGADDKKPAAEGEKPAGDAPAAEKKPE